MHIVPEHGNAHCTLRWTLHLNMAMQIASKDIIAMPILHLKMAAWNKSVV